MVLQHIIKLTKNAMHLERINSSTVGTKENNHTNLSMDYSLLLTFLILHYSLRLSDFKLYSSTKSFPMHHI